VNCLSDRGWSTIDGWCRADRFGIGSALAVTSVFFAAGGALIYLLPETRGEDLGYHNVRLFPEVESGGPHE